MKQVFRRLAFLLVLLAVLLSVCYMLWPHSFADLQPECDSVTILRSDTAEDYSYTITKEIYSTDSPELKQIMDILSHYTYHRSFRTLAGANNTGGNHAGFWLHIYLDHGDDRVDFTCGGTGEILIDGQSIRERPLECKRKMAYIPDNPDLYEFLSGIQYLNFVADIYRIPREEREQAIRQYADMLELTDDLAQPVSAYSHGMKQKLAIISALIHHPRLLILDEPFVGLDPKASHLLKELMHHLCGEGGAIFFSTHVLEVAEKLCDEIAIIRKGKLIVSGPTDEVKGNSSLENVFLELEGDHV